jgi:nucleoid-associated protein YgaU
MGLFSFIKSAGEALAGGQPVTSESLVEHIKSLNLKIDKLFVSYDGKTCVLFGNVPDQAEKEKAILAVGNLHGVDQVVDKLNIEAGAGAGGTNTAPAAPEAVDPSKEPAGQPESQFYTVVSGDNLSHIAKHFYGDANKYAAIFEANKPMLKSPDKIYPGQVLRIPKL